MKKNIVISIILFMTVLLVAPSTSIATTGSNTSVAVTTLNNPLKSTSLYCFFRDILTAFLNLLVVLAIFYLIYSGFQMVSARGNEKALTEAKQSFTYAVIGTAVLLGAWTIATIIKTTVESVTETTITNNTSC